MKMTYHRTRFQNKTKTQILLSAFFALILLFFFKGEAIKKILMPLALRIYLPFSSIEKIISEKSEILFLGIKDKRALIEENQKLKEKLAELEAAALTTTPLEKENKTLKEAIGLKTSRSYIAANIIHGPPQPFFDSLIIDAGEDDGIFKGMPVTAFSQILLGKISKINKNNSVVQLISSPGVQTDAILEGSGIAATLVGQGGGNLMLKLPRTFEVKIGERIITPDSRLFIGIVEIVKKDNIHPLQEILLRMPLNLSELRYVLVNNY